MLLTCLISHIIVNNSLQLRLTNYKRCVQGFHRHLDDGSFPQDSPTQQWTNHARFLIDNFAGKVGSLKQGVFIYSHGMRIPQHAIIFFRGHSAGLASPRQAMRHRQKRPAAGV